MTESGDKSLDILGVKPIAKSIEKVHGEKELKAHPLISWRIIENSSLAQHDELQEIWAGLLTSTCTEDDSNITFINLISQLTEIQIKILNYAVENATIKVHNMI